LTVAGGLEAKAILSSLRALKTTHVVTVPDTHQRTVLDLLDQEDRIPVVRAATEDDVLGICGGLWIGGQRPIALIQQLGIFASINALRAITHDLRLPLAILAGMYGREVDLGVEQSPKSSVRLCQPVLAALDIPSLLIDRPDQAGLIAPWLEVPFADGGTRVVLLGAATT
jgi:sulfopyruvate decarboxylase TPP-binding subunit